jgi:hypothetical protein
VTGKYLSHYRLERSDAVRVISEMVVLDIEQCASLATVTHPKAYPPPLVTQLPTAGFLRDIRSGVLSIAEEHGFPHRKKTKDTTLSAFDVKVGNFLLSSLAISPADAGMEETWNFLSLVLLPDVAAWRFQNKTKNPEYDRWIGRPRNVFRKAWWRAYCLGPDLNATLGEDEGVNIMERPTFGLNPTLARAIARAHNEYSNDYSLARSELLRLVMVQLGKLSSIVNLDSLPEGEITKLVDNTYHATADKFEPTIDS